MKRTLVGHNVYAFDCIALERGGVKFDYSRVEDTLLAHHAYASHLPQRMDQVVSVYCDSGPWKVKFGRRGAEEKGLPPHKMPVDELTLYNAADCRLESKIWAAMQTDLFNEREVYRKDKQLALLCQGMQKAGIRVDLERRAELSKALRYRAAGLLGEMRQLVRKQSFNPHKLADLRSALYGRFGAPMLIPTPTGQPSTGVALLQALRGQDTRAGRLSDLVLKWRGAKKVRSTYIDGVNIGSDGRVHATWKAFGTVSGRLSCRMQQLPRKETAALEDRPRELYIPAPGCVFVYFDVSQAEMRLASQLSGDVNFMKVCAEKDVHSANAVLIFPYARELIENPKNDDEKKKRGFFRSIAKETGFAVNYFAGEETLFLRLQGKDLPTPVTMQQVRSMLSTIHRAFRVHFAYVDSNVELCKRQGYLRTPISGRIRWFGTSPKPTEVANFPVQAGVADIMNDRLITMSTRLPRGCRLIFQGHDSAVYECKIGRSASLMESLIEETWDEEVVLPSSGRHFKLPIDKKRGERLSEL
jgi:DNA polymerase I